MQVKESLLFAIELCSNSLSISFQSWLSNQFTKSLFQWLIFVISNEGFKYFDSKKCIKLDNYSAQNIPPFMIIVVKWSTIFLVVVVIVSFKASSRLTNGHLPIKAGEIFYISTLKIVVFKVKEKSCLQNFSYLEIIERKRKIFWFFFIATIDVPLFNEKIA